MPYWRLFYHVVWATTGRAPIIDAAREETIRRSIRTTCAEHGAPVHAIGVMPDHIHLAVSIPPRVALSAFLHAIKGSSSHLVNHVGADEGRETFGWQPEYGILSFGERSPPTSSRTSRTRPPTTPLTTSARPSNTSNAPST